MLKVNSRMVLVERIVGSAYDIEELNEELTRYAEGNGEEAMKNLMILNVLHEVPTVDTFPLEKVEGELRFSELDYANSGTYILPDWNDREFDDIDELNDWVKEQIKKGVIDLDEARSLDIQFVQGCELDIEQDDDYWRLKVEDFETKHTEAMDVMGIEYIPAHIAEKQEHTLQQQIEDMDALMQQKTPDTMSDDEISFEINQLEVRIQKLMSEQLRRKVTVYLNIKA